MTGEMLGQPVQHSLDFRFVLEARGVAQPGGALTIVGEKAVDIGRADTAIGRHGAIGPPVGEGEQRPGAIGSRGAADMHFIAAERRAAG